MRLQEANQKIKELSESIESQQSTNIEKEVIYEEADDENADDENADDENAVDDVKEETVEATEAKIQIQKNIQETQKNIQKTVTNVRSSLYSTLKEVPGIGGAIEVYQKLVH